MIKEIVAPRESVAGHRTLAILVSAQMRFGTVAMHAVSLPLVAKKTSGGGESHADASFDLAPEGSQVGIDVFAVQG